MDGIYMDWIHFDPEEGVGSSSPEQRVEYSGCL
jgi:hypothetical protein